MLSRIARFGRLVGLLSLGLFSSTPAAASNGKGHGPEAVALALEIENGEGIPVDLVAGGRYYVNQIDIRTVLFENTDSGVQSLFYEGDFADLPWLGTRKVDEDFVHLANADGTYTRRRYYRDALWMELPSYFYIRQLDARGREVGPTITLNAGIDAQSMPSDDFFIRRFGAIQWTRDCASVHDCSNARNYEVEALVELRNARGKPRTFNLHPHAAALQVIWSLKPWQRYEIPVRQVRNPQWDYGFKIDVTPLTPPQRDGTYAPGTDITFRMTLKDGKGTRLHPQGVLPTYSEVVFGGVPSGIQYYRAFFDASTTYYRRKHRERMLMVQIVGPAQNIQPMRSVADLSIFLVPGSQVVATPERDGVFGEFTIMPDAGVVFGGAFHPTNDPWFAPVTDTFTFHIPENADPGTYLVTAKGRRTFMGEDIPYSTTIEIQVGQRQRTVAHLTTGRCETCHNNGGELSKVLHGNDNRAACNACHVPLSFEPEGPIYVRTHFIHSRSDRFDAPLHRCSTCHLSEASTQRTSKSACLSCHKSYPDSHVARFGPVENMYVGGTADDSFVQCTDACHTSHPRSGF